MLRYIYMLMCVQLIIVSVTLPSQKNNQKLQIAILGLGGRSQYLLLDCLKLNKNIQVVAVCDNHAKKSFNFFLNKLKKQKNNLLNIFKNCFDNTSFYPDTTQGLQQLFKNHKNIDKILITSVNYRHLAHLNATLLHSSCKNIYIEKPLFKNLDEFTNFHLNDENAHILVGLTLRYSSMSTIVVQKLQQYKAQLGTLKQVKAWEGVRFCQGLTSFMMSWRRYKSLSGGFLIEKSIHDLDLALFFMQSLGIDPKEVAITTESLHKFYTQSNKETILSEIKHNSELKSTLLGRELSPFQRLIPFSFNQDGSIDWPITTGTIFKDIPNTTNDDDSDIIPDYHKLHATITPSEGTDIDFELEVDIASFRPTTKRGMKFIFEHGEVIIDVMQSNMTITLHDQTQHTFDLQTNNSDHADGDEYIARALLGTLQKGQYTATFYDPIVQLASIMGFVSEKQSLLKDKNTMYLRKKANQWILI